MLIEQIKAQAKSHLVFLVYPYHTVWRLWVEGHHKLLTIAEAKKRKADQDTHSKKQQKLLLQAEQPRAIQCAS